jgi:large-conductance mechanosensitive channel
MSEGQIIVGACWSSIVITVVHEIVCPLLKVTVQTTGVFPVGSISPAIVAVLFRLFLIVPPQGELKVASNSELLTVYVH